MATAALLSSFPTSDLTVEQSREVCIKLPQTPLAPQSLQVTTLKAKDFLKWDQSEHAACFRALQKTVQIWEQKKIAKQYLVYSKLSLRTASPFQWEAIPYSTCTKRERRFVQQFKVLWNITFGGNKLAKPEQERQLFNYKAWFSELSSLPTPTTPAPSTDPFCNLERIEKQRVLEGKFINILYNYKPIGVGGEKLHFLVIPKAHKASFHELSEEEYVEAMQLTQKIITHFSKTRPIQEVYLYHKSGVDAGQSVPHWHLHIVFITSQVQNIFGKLTVLKNMAIESSPMKEDELQQKVLTYQAELKKVKEA